MQWAQVLESLHPHHRQLVALAWQIHFALQSYCLSLVGVSLPTTYSPRVGCWDWLPKWRFWSLLLGFSILLCLFLWSLCYFAASLDAFLVALLDLCPYCLPLTISWQAHSMIFYLAFIVWTRMNYTINRSLPILISCTSLPSHSATYSYEDNLSPLRIVSLLKSCIPQLTILPCIVLPVLCFHVPTSPFLWSHWDSKTLLIYSHPSCDRAPDS